MMYADRDIQALEPYYSMHVLAMTEEALHAKSDVAAELAHRDKEIRCARNKAFCAVLWELNQRIAELKRFPAWFRDKHSCYRDLRFYRRRIISLMHMEFDYASRRSD